MDLSVLLYLSSPFIAAFGSIVLTVWYYIKRALKPPTIAPSTTPRVVIIGGGYGGVVSALEFQKRGIPFTIIEKGSDFGGTWLFNIYPGAACDIPSILYCLEDEPSAEWSRHHPCAPEIQAYVARVATKRGLREHTKFGRSVSRCVWDEEKLRWFVTLDNGAVLEAGSIVDACGPLHKPAYPTFPDGDAFEGPRMHTGAWDTSFDATGKHVAVIGTGASAIQAVPELAKKAASLTVFQRTPSWIIERGDFAWPSAAKSLFRTLPFLQRIVRSFMYIRREINFLVAFDPKALAGKLARHMLVKRIVKEVGPELAPTLTPTYPIGCKRVLISDDYYPAMCRPNVTVTTQPIVGISRSAVVTKAAGEGGASKEYPVDAVVYATGFDLLGARPEIVGIGNRNFLQAQAAQKHTYATFLGAALPGFPNCWTILGPNTALGHNSVVLMMEAQARAFAELTARAAVRGIPAISVRQDKHDAWADRVRSTLSGAVWDNCTSWYQINGVNVSLWPSLVHHFSKETEAVTLGDFVHHV